MGFSTDPPFIPDAANAMCTDAAVATSEMLLVCNQAVLLCSNAGILRGNEHGMRREEEA